jgi:hypothetical protein
MTRGRIWETIGYDGNGVPRVYGNGPTPDVAESRCMAESRDYVARRRDTGPLDAWRFEPIGYRGAA